MVVDVDVPMVSTGKLRYNTNDPPSGNKPYTSKNLVHTVAEESSMSAIPRPRYEDLEVGDLKMKEGSKEAKEQMRSKW